MSNKISKLEDLHLGQHLIYLTHNKRALVQVLGGDSIASPNTVSVRHAFWSEGTAPFTVSIDSLRYVRGDELGKYLEVKSHSDRMYTAIINGTVLPKTTTEKKLSELLSEIQHILKDKEGAGDPEGWITTLKEWEALILREECVP